MRKRQRGGHPNSNRAVRLEQDTTARRASEFHSHSAFGAGQHSEAGIRIPIAWSRVWSRTAQRGGHPNYNRMVPCLEQDTHSALRPAAKTTTCKASSPAVFLNAVEAIRNTTRNPVTLASDCKTATSNCGYTVCTQSICSEVKRLQSMRMIVSLSRWNSLPPRRSRSNRERSPAATRDKSWSFCGIARAVLSTTAGTSAGFLQVVGFKNWRTCLRGRLCFLQERRFGLQRSF